MKIAFRKFGLIEGVFRRLAQYFGEESLFGKLFTVLANLSYKTHLLFLLFVNKIKDIGFTKTHLKLYATYQLLNIAFVLQGLIPLLTLGLIHVNLTGRPSVHYSRATKDFIDYKAEKKLKQSPEDEESIPKHVRERIERKNKSDEDLDKELDELLTNRRD